MLISKKKRELFKLTTLPSSPRQWQEKERKPIEKVQGYLLKHIPKIKQMGQLHYRPLDKESMHTQSCLSLGALDILEAKARDRPLKTSQRLVRPTLYTRACKELA
jgi:hypothetical protein